jgi:hypothetical protein
VTVDLVGQVAALPCPDFHRRSYGSIHCDSLTCIHETLAQGCLIEQRVDVRDWFSGLLSARTKLEGCLDHPLLLPSLDLFAAACTVNPQCPPADFVMRPLLPQEVYDLMSLLNVADGPAPSRLYPPHEPMDAEDHGGLCGCNETGRNLSVFSSSCPLHEGL